jgi:flagellar FliL protein
MLRSRVFVFLIALLIAITMILTAAFILYNYLENSQGSLGQTGVKPLSAAAIRELTVHISDITTNLAGEEKYIRISFAFELDSKKAKEEFQQLDFKVKDLIMRTLADMQPEQVKGSKGQDALISILMNKINGSILTQGKLRQVYITEMVLQ